MDYNKMADTLAELIEKNEAPWQRTWEGFNQFPHNAKTSKEYNGINLMNLMAVGLIRGYTDTRWVTFAQAKELNASIKKGEKGTPIIYFQDRKKIKELDENGEEVENEVKIEKPIIKRSIVFNAEQCNNMPPIEIKKIDFSPIEKAEEILKNSGAKIEHKTSNRAYYNKVTDTIILPHQNQFHSKEEYYRTALHEMGHWTGHASRNGRDLSGEFGSESYAREELVAEITSFLVGIECGLGHIPNENNIAYIKAWSKKIKDDPSYLMKALKDADKASKLILSKSLKLEQKQEKEEQTQEQDKQQENKIQKEIASKKCYLAIPYQDKDEAKALGAKWDMSAKSWYCYEDNLNKFHKWEIKNIEYKERSSISVEDEFLSKIKELGVDDNEIIADGRPHRIRVDSDKKNEKSGFYILHADGVPNGYFKNNRTGQEIKWVSNALSNEFSQEQKALFNARKAEKEQENKLEMEKSIKKLSENYNKKIQLKDTTYLDNKNISVTKDIYASSYGDMMIPLYNIDGDLKSAQYIKPDGSKAFAKNCEIKGSFHLIDSDFNSIKDNSVVIISEGYATANTINEALKKDNQNVPIIAAMSAGNIDTVITALNDKYKNVSIIIAADNDNTKKINVGVETAKKLSDKHKNVTYLVPKSNGDFNDMIKDKKTKDNAIKQISNLFQNEIKKNHNKVKNSIGLSI